MSSTLPRIMHGDSVAGYGWRLADALWEEAEYAVDDLMFHDDDLMMVRNHYEQQIDAIQDAFLLSVVDSNRGRITAYHLKQNEMLAIALDVDDMVGTPILDAESGGDSDDRADLLEKWQAKSTAWLSVVGASERALRLAKENIADCNNDADMRAIVDGFPAVLRGDLND